jgi:hypothetical protein
MEDSKWYLGDLTEKEWNELVTLEYVLTFRYSNDYEADDRRYRELAPKSGIRNYYANNKINP